jgi:hypothetical protein
MQWALALAAQPRAKARRVVSFSFAGLKPGASTWEQAHLLAVRGPSEPGSDVWDRISTLESGTA